MDLEDIPLVQLRELGDLFAESFFIAAQGPGIKPAAELDAGVQLGIHLELQLKNEVTGVVFGTEKTVFRAWHAGDEDFADFGLVKGLSAPLDSVIQILAVESLNPVLLTEADGTDEKGGRDGH